MDRRDYVTIARAELDKLITDHNDAVTERDRLKARVTEEEARACRALAEAERAQRGEAEAQVEAESLKRSLYREERFSREALEKLNEALAEKDDFQRLASDRLDNWYSAANRLETVKANLLAAQHRLADYEAKAEADETTIADLRSALEAAKNFNGFRNLARYKAKAEADETTIAMLKADLDRAEYLADSYKGSWEGVEDFYRESLRREGALKEELADAQRELKTTEYKLALEERISRGLGETLHELTLEREVSKATGLAAEKLEAELAQALYFSNKHRDRAYVYLRLLKASLTTTRFSVEYQLACKLSGKSHQPSEALKALEMRLYQEAYQARKDEEEGPTLDCVSAEDLAKVRAERDKAKALWASVWDRLHVAAYLLRESLAPGGIKVSGEYELARRTAGLSDYDTVAAEVTERRLLNKAEAERTSRGLTCD